MRHLKPFLFSCLALLAFGTAVGQQLPGNHDPVAIKEGDTYYVFSTGRGINVLSSTDMVTWKPEKAVFDPIPQWPAQTIPGFRGNSFWAPDIIKRGDTYYIYYSASAFGENTSAIGVATAKTLDPASPDFGWTDHGKVIQSIPGRDFWNAIDPNIIIDEEGTPWMNFGSFWGGIMMVKLNSDMLSVAQPEEWYALCRRERNYLLDITDPGNGAVEAPFIFRKGDYYYLFVSFDYCCRGARSDYKVVVGRSKDVRGPYLDRNGFDMFKGGSTLVLAGNRQWPGVGHCSVYNFDGKDLMFFHGYDMEDNGRSKLLIRELKWDGEGWPTAEL
jgi:arabinan endo-1,5-alpha-L-arabinosidase